MKFTSNHKKKYLHLEDEWQGNFRKYAALNIYFVDTTLLGTRLKAV